MTAGRARTVFVGSGGFGRPSLERLRQHPMVELVGVVTAPAKPVGRRQDVTTTPIGAAAAALGIEPILTPARLRSRDAIDQVLALRPDMIVLADYGQIVPRELLELPKGALNLHPSILPRHRGATPIPATILAGDAEAGVTLMQMDDGLDTGPFIAATTIDLRGDETTPELEAELGELAADLLAATLSPWIRGIRTAHPQPESGATVTRALRRDDGRLDPNRSGVELERQVRAYQPWPGSFVEAPDGRLIIWRAVPERYPGSPAPGVFDAGGLGVGSGERLRLVEVQPAGGRRMSWDAYVRGHPSIVGASIVQ